jgi:hypothetical protein
MQRVKTARVKRGFDELHGWAEEADRKRPRRGRVLAGFA